MRVWQFLTVTAALAIGTACASDKDGDGLTKKEEEAAGTDFEVADSDGDGLNDGEELGWGSDPLKADSDDDGLADNDEKSLGTDPKAADSDGDGYRDADEVSMDSDPTDADDVIYQGGWPFYAGKEDIANPGTTSRAREGDILGRMQFTDQFGDLVDLYDFAYQGKPVVIDVSGVWCYWCHQAAAFLEGEKSAFDSYEQYKELPGLVEDGAFYWITILDADASGGTADEQDVQDWFDDYPNPAIPVLLDAEQESTAYFRPRGYPYMILVEEDMTISMIPANYMAIWDELIARYGA